MYGILVEKSNPSSPASPRSEHRAKCTPLVVYLAKELGCPTYGSALALAFLVLVSNRDQTSEMYGTLVD